MSRSMAGQARLVIPPDIVGDGDPAGVSVVLDSVSALANARGLMIAYGVDDGEVWIDGDSPDKSYKSTLSLALFRGELARGYDAMFELLPHPLVDAAIDDLNNHVHSKAEFTRALLLRDANAVLSAADRAGFTVLVSVLQHACSWLSI